MASIKLFQLQNFLSSDFKSLPGDWHRGRLATMSTPKTFKTPTEEHTTNIALELIHQGDLKRGISLIEGHGRSNPDDPDIRQQVKGRHPRDGTA
jgi:hypothetical protein